MTALPRAAKDGREASLVTVFTTTPPRTLDDPEFGEHFLRLVGDGDEYGAVEAVTDLLDDGVPARRVMIDLIARTQGRVGECTTTRRRWHCSAPV